MEYGSITKIMEFYNLTNVITPNYMNEGSITNTMEFYNLIKVYP